jgi:hypothetical protein
MNGLINIYADNIEATNSSVDTLIVDGKDINTVTNQVDTNKINLTGITYTATPTPTTNISNKLIVSSIDATNASIFRANLNLLGQLSVSGTTTFNGLTNWINQLNAYEDSTFEKKLFINDGIYSYGLINEMLGTLKVLENIEVSKNLYIGKNSTSQISSIDVNGTIYLRDPSQPNVVFMKIYYEPNLYGFVFQSETQGRNMNFRVKDNAGNYKLFYFGAGQLYSAIFTYIDTGLNVSFNNRFTLGDSNGSTQWFGVSQMYVPNTSVTSGYVTYNKGLMNNATYYSNWVHVNTSNIDVPTMRMSWQGIWSKVPHTMESTLSVAGNLTLTGDLIANSINISPIELSYLDNVTSNIQTQLNSKLNTTGGTISGNLALTGFLNTQAVSFSGNGSVQTTAYTTALNTKLTAIGTTVIGTLSNTTTLVIGGIFNCGSMSLSPGTYMICCFCYVDVQGGATTINNMSAAYSTSATAYSHEVDATWSGGGLSYNSGSTFSLNHTDFIVVDTTTTYYMICRCNFGTVLRMRFIKTFSKFSAVRIA